MRKLDSMEVGEVDGGIGLLLPLSVALMDTAGWTSCFGAFAAGWFIGDFISGNADAVQREDLTNYNYF